MTGRSGTGPGPVVPGRPDPVPLRLLFLNAFLLRPLSLGLGPLRWEPGAAPAVADRADELGRTVAGAYDVIALAEAFTAAERDRVRAGWPAGARPAVAVGPEGGWGRSGGRTTTSSGLATLVDGPEVVRVERHRYRAVGHRLADADPWAAKGVLLVEVDVGLPGGLEVYSTHLCAGGGLLPVGGDRVAGTDAVRRAQAEELVAFVEAHHRPGNVALVVGDVNVPAGGGPDTELASVLGRMGLEDLWPRLGRGPGVTCGLERVGAELGRPDPVDPRFADDDIGVGSVGGEGVDPPERIDRAFLQRPRPEHGLVVEAALLRRRPFPRRADAPDRHRLPFLSDHMGLHLELTLAPA